MMNCSERFSVLRILFSFIFLNLFLTSCSSTIAAQRHSYIQAYQAGDLVEAESRLNVLAEEEIPSGKYGESKEASWILLDRATLHFAMGKTAEAIKDYAHAMESLDYYAQESSAEKAAQLLIEDESGAYQADDFEHILARVYFALALLHEGDENNAYALLRQAEEYVQKRRNIYTKIPFMRQYQLLDNGLSKYLFALLLDKRGDRSNAEILFKQAGQLIPDSKLNHLYSCRQSQQGTVLVLCHNGNAPRKVSGKSPGSVASLAALEFLLATQQIDPAWSSLTGIPVPILKHSIYSNPMPTYAEIDGVNKPIMPVYSVCYAAETELKQKMPVIVARGVARLLMRRCAVGYFQEKDPALGMLADVTMCVLNDQTKADTRSWTTLPAFIEAARFDLEAGEHALTIRIYDPIGLKQKKYHLCLKPNDLCIIHIFNIHPGITQILIPHRYLVNEGDFYETH